MIFTFDRKGTAPTSSRTLSGKLDGEWSLADIVENGAKLPVPPTTKVAMSVADGVVIERELSSLSGTIEFQKDTNKIEFTPSTKKNRQKALWKYDPESQRLTICEASIASDYPADFIAKPGTSWTVRVFKREDRAGK